MFLLVIVSPLYGADQAQPIMMQDPTLQLRPSTTNLTIGVTTYTPPFVMQGGNNDLYGYDISMMESLCKIMNKTCKFQPIRWIDLLPAVMNNKVDLAVSSITITPERSKVINFSLPYSLSYSRLLTNQNAKIKEPFSVDSLNGKRIGVYKGTIYEDNAAHMGIINPVIETYIGYEDALKALTNNEVDFILLDNPTALYWAANSSGAFKVVGKPSIYGFGLGIAVSPGDKDLIPELNKALLQYQNSEEYRLNYKRYLDVF